MSGYFRLSMFALVMALVGVVGCGKKNAAPVPPDVSGPSVGKPGATLAFGFTSTDPNHDEVSYLVDWGDGTPTAWSPPRPSGEQFAQYHVYPESGRYFVKALARDNDQMESPWSDSHPVSIGFFPPNAPFRPSGTSACVPGIVYAYKTKTIHPLGDSVAFQFWWGDSLGDWGPMVDSGESYQSSRVFETLGVYRVAARARDARGLESGWSDSLTVTVDTAQVNPGGAPRNLVLYAATDSTVFLNWTAPSDSQPIRYVVSFRRTGSPRYDSVGSTIAPGFDHDPAGKTGRYQVTAVYGSGRFTSTETPSTAPVGTGLLRVFELNAGDKTGYGWDRTTGQASLYDMTTSDSAGKVDLYVTDFAPGYAGPDYWVANPFFAPQDPGGGVPAGAWRVVRFSGLDTLMTENDPLPRYTQSRYRDSLVLSPLPALVACHTEDGYYALIKATAVDVDEGTADIQTWFQLIRNLRLMEH